MQNQIHRISFLVILITGLPLLLNGGIDVQDTKFLLQPAISQTHVAFMYASDLWVANIDGSAARRLTTAEGFESDPVFSPDGSLIAFSAEYDGNVDVYTVPAEGGIPKRLTWHPYNDTVQSFTPDGKSVLFISPRYVFTGRYTQLFTVPVEGGFPVQLQIPNVDKATYSPDGSQMAYTPIAGRFRQFKRYRGGTVSTIWVYTFKDHSVIKIPQPEGRCNDTDPMWIGDKIYFLSDRNGEFNLYSFDLQSESIRQLTRHEDFPILSASAGGGKIIYSQAAHLHIFDPQAEQSGKLTIGVAADLIETRPRYVKDFRYIRSTSISPSGARAVLEYRGEIVTIPAEKGDPRNLTNTPGAHERSPIWSPDGKKIAYFSEASGEYELHIKNQDGRGTIQSFKIEGAGFYDTPVWSPDSQKISFADNSLSLYWIDLKTGTMKKIGSNYSMGIRTGKTIHSAWSPDSNWITYAINTSSYMHRVYIYSLEQDKSYPVSDGMSDVNDPVFDKSGKHLYFFASTDAGPVNQWFALSNMDMEMTRSVYLAVLRQDIPSPLAKENDEEQGSDKKETPKKDEEKTPEALTIDFEGLNNRIISLPIPAKNYFSLQTGDEGQIFYLEAPAKSRGPFGEDVKLLRFDMKKRKSEEILSGINGYELTADKKKILYWSTNSMGIAPAGSEIKPGQGKLNTDAIENYIDPRIEWKQIFDEAWRINRDYFYATNMHGVDWEAMKKKYEVFLPHLSCRMDLNLLIQWMCSELAVGHHRVSGGDFLEEPTQVPGGLLGADFSVENGLYRFKKIYGGLNWNPDLRSPLTEPGVNVKEGDYLLAVNGNEIKHPDNLYKFFENTAEKIVEITVSPNPDGTGSKTVSVVPIANESSLRNRDWVEGNIKKVDEATGGRVAYVYVPNTSTSGHTYFKRYFFPQIHKQAVIVDERFNGGGLVADYYIDILRRPFASYWHTRYGADIKTPGASIQGPKVMLIDETAGSGGDMLPWMFRKFKLGKLIGKRTWGGLVGTLGFPILMDGGYVTAPNLAIWTEDGWIVENVGVPPDIEVEQWPAEVIAGKDPQLQKAIEVILEELKLKPPKMPKRPPYPKR